MSLQIRHSRIPVGVLASRRGTRDPQRGVAVVGMVLVSHTLDLSESVPRYLVLLEKREGPDVPVAGDGGYGGATRHLSKVRGPIEMAPREPRRGCSAGKDPDYLRAMSWDEWGRESVRE